LDDKWQMLKEKHNLNNMLFSILDSKLNDKFYSKKLKLKPLDEAPPSRFKYSLEKWIQNGSPEDVATKAIWLNSHYKYDKVDNMSSLLDVINKESSALFLQDDATRTIAVICTTHNTKDIPIVLKGLDWESFLIGLFNAKATFMVVACICDQKMCKNLFIIVCKLIFVTKI
jgi:hypothetical protein